MSRYCGNGEECPICGMLYVQFRTGLRYQDVFEMMMDNSEDSSDWTYKRRHTVLGKWYQIKQELWTKHLEECEQQQDYDQDRVGPQAAT